jgi:hypothetical protein
VVPPKLEYSPTDLGRTLSAAFCERGVGRLKILSKLRGGARQTRQDNGDGGPVIGFTKPKDNRCYSSIRLSAEVGIPSGNQALTRCAFTCLAKTSYFWARPFTRAMVLH